MKMEDAPTYATTPLDHINAAVLLINFLAVTIRLVSVSSTYVNIQLIVLYLQCMLKKQCHAFDNYL